MFTKFPSESSVIDTWLNAKEKPVVSFACVTYMHASYILDTLYGFVKQQTNFPFEIVCYDDCSSDGTREIIQAFASRYPKIVRTVFPKKNQRSLGIKPLFDILIPLCRGRYIAACEGDDYWSDPQKIQKQADFLERHMEYSVTTHSIANIDSDGELLDLDWLPAFYRRDFTEQEVRTVWCSVQIQAMMFRNVIQEMPLEMKKAPTGDVFFSSIIGCHGKSKYLPDIKPSMYRQHNGGVFSTLSDSDRDIQQSLNFYWLYRYYRRIGFWDEARVLKLRYIERSLREIPLSDLLRLVYMKLRPSRIKDTLSAARR